jgi:hypothetical protein
MSYRVGWERKYDRPTVGGKVQNPVTGEIEDVKTNYWFGPPNVDVIWHNMNANLSFSTIRAPYNAPIEEVFLQIAEHVREGAYKIISLSATRYSFHIICTSDLTNEEIRKHTQRMAENLAPRGDDGELLPYPLIPKTES